MLNVTSRLNDIPPPDIVQAYVNTLTRTVSNTLIAADQSRLLSRVITDGPIYAVGLTIQLRAEHREPFSSRQRFVEDTGVVAETLREGRVLRFDDQTAWILKIPRGAFWTQTAALNDADWFVSHVLVGGEPSLLGDQPS